MAIRCKDGVVFGVEKLVLSKLYEEGSNKRIFNIDRHVGMVNKQTNIHTHPYPAVRNLPPSPSVSFSLSLSLSLSRQAVAGLLADARSLADVAREEASSFRSNYGHDIPLKVCHLVTFCFFNKWQPWDVLQLALIGAVRLNSDAFPLAWLQETF